MSRAESTRTLDAEEAKQSTEEARRNRLYNIMACIREVQKRNDRTGVQ